jgi:hypothetical protein
MLLDHLAAAPPADWLSGLVPAWAHAPPSPPPKMA